MCLLAIKLIYATRNKYLHISNSNIFYLNSKRNKRIAFNSEICIIQFYVQDYRTIANFLVVGVGETGINCNRCQVTFEFVALSVALNKNCFVHILTVTNHYTIVLYSINSLESLVLNRHHCPVKVVFSLTAQKF